MIRNGYAIAVGEDVLNIVYISSEDKRNTFDDTRLVFRVATPRSHPEIVRAWPCTTEPGAYYVRNRINPKGAAQLAPGQYTAWQVGLHRGHHEALVQTGGPVVVYRDDNEDFHRAGDRTDTGYFGINQHGPGIDGELVDRNSAGCLVAKTMAGHREFMALVKTDERYLRDKNFVFTSTLITESELLLA